MQKIAFMAPNKERLQRIRTLLKDFREELLFVVGSLDDGIATAKKLIEQGVEIIIARGETAYNIRDMFPSIVVVDVPISGFDLALSLEEARKYGDRVAVVSFPSMIKQVELLESALGIHIKKYNLQSRGQIDSAIDDALRDGADVILGGYTTVEAAKRRGLAHVYIHTGDQAYLETFYNARSVLNSIEAEKQRSGFIRAVLNHTYDGIISVDATGVMQSINPTGKRILKLSVQEGQKVYLKDICPALELDSIIKTGKEELNQIYKIKDTTILCNKAPINDRTGVIGAVATFQDITRIQSMESRIRNEIYTKGHVAIYTFADIISSDPSIRTVLGVAKSFAATEANVLITGETGVGKEVFAQSIHSEGKRNQGPFVAVNCAALPAQLLESELFGYVGGAFTGARKEGKPGLFEMAHGGTIFLDEIGEINYASQGRLLRVLQERAVMRLGSDRIIPVDVRVIAATNKSLHELALKGKFREDLYYRLAVLSMRIPPLRNRLKDIVHYAHKFLTEITAATGQDIRLSAGAVKVLQEHRWPGNIRELRNVMERLAAIAQRESISAAFMSAIVAGEYTVSEPIDTEEAELISQTLTKCGGRMAEAAQRLQMNRTTLWRKMRKLGIKQQD